MSVNTAEEAAKVLESGGMVSFTSFLSGVRPVYKLVNGRVRCGCDAKLSGNIDEWLRWKWYGTWEVYNGPWPVEEPPQDSLPSADDSATVPGDGVGDAVNHPAHYNSHPSGVECITIVEHMTFCCGNVVKYLWRAGLKVQEGEGRRARLEDLKKARWYLDREIAFLEKDLGGES